MICLSTFAKKFIDVSCSINKTGWLSTLSCFPIPSDELPPVSLTATRFCWNRVSYSKCFMDLIQSKPKKYKILPSFSFFLFFLLLKSYFSFNAWFYCKGRFMHVWNGHKTVKRKKKRKKEFPGMHSSYFENAIFHQNN